MSDPQDWQQTVTLMQEMKPMPDDLEGEIEGPSWAPDSDRLAFQLTQEDNMVLYVASADGEALYPLPLPGMNALPHRAPVSPSEWDYAAHAEPLPTPTSEAGNL